MSSAHLSSARLGVAWKLEEGDKKDSRPKHQSALTLKKIIGHNKNYALFEGDDEGEPYNDADNGSVVDPNNKSSQYVHFRVGKCLSKQVVRFPQLHFSVYHSLTVSSFNLLFNAFTH